MPSINTTYKFSIVPNSFIGQEQIGTLKSVCDYETAMMIADVSQIHINIYPNLPAGTSLDPKTLEYYIIAVSDTAKIVISSSWLTSEPEIITNIEQQYVLEFKTNAERLNFDRVVADYGFKVKSSVQIN